MFFHGCPCPQQRWWPCSTQQFQCWNPPVCQQPIVCPQPICPSPFCTVTTGTATAVAATTATIAGNTFSCNTSGIVRSGVQVGTDPSLTTVTETLSGTLQSPFSVTLTGLVPGTTYYYRAFVDSGCNRFFGNILTFTTAVSTPTVTTGAAINITNAAATITGNTYSGVPGTVTSTAVEYSVNPTFAGSQTSAGTLTNPFSAALSGLAPATTYFYRAIINTTGGVFQGNALSFTTLL